MSEAFKKVSLHDIAKKYSKEIFSKKAVQKYEDIKQKNPQNESVSAEDSNKINENTKEVMKMKIH